MFRTATVLAALTLVAGPAFAAEPGSDASVSLTFETASDTGAVMVALYDQTTYGGGQPIRAARIDVTTGERSVTFTDLPAGEYGVKAFHDVNGNGRMDTNPFGMPTEPFAFSNNARGNMGPAGWDRARFTVAGTTSQIISIR